jgi:hypothetical protein
VGVGVCFLLLTVSQVYSTTTHTHTHTHLFSSSASSSTTTTKHTHTHSPLFLLFLLLHHHHHHQTGPLARGLVACTGAQFCGVGLIETKTRAIDLVEKLEAAYDIPQTVRMHFSGCPNSCGQSQVADIGLMGAPAKKDGKAVEGADIFLGGAVGEGEFELLSVLGARFCVYAWFLSYLLFCFNLIHFRLHPC